MRSSLDLLSPSEVQLAMSSFLSSSWQTVVWSVSKTIHSDVGPDNRLVQYQSLEVSRQLRRKSRPKRLI
jgi:hypothetical protein